MSTRDGSALQDALPLVLVVDDETRSLEAIQRNLEEDFRILTASCVSDARGLLERHDVSVILCDQRMPGVSGVEFLKEVRLGLARLCSHCDLGLFRQRRHHCRRE
jgi:two-component system response regulator HupR/HoxA